MGNGKTKLAWVKKTTHADNHYLDCEVYALAAADILGVRTLHLEDMEKTEQRKPHKEEKMETPEEDWIRANENWI